MNVAKNAMPTSKDTGVTSNAKELRSKSYLAHGKFAAKRRATFPTVNPWENGVGKPSPLSMRQIEDLIEMALGAA